MAYDRAAAEVPRVRLAGAAARSCADARDAVAAGAVCCAGGDCGRCQTRSAASGRGGRGSGRGGRESHEALMRSWPTMTSRPWRTRRLACCGSQASERLPQSNIRRRTILPLGTHCSPKAATRNRAGVCSLPPPGRSVPIVISIGQGRAGRARPHAHRPAAESRADHRLDPAAQSRNRSRVPGVEAAHRPTACRTTACGCPRAATTAWKPYADAQGRRFRLRSEEIESALAVGSSIMPDGLDATLTVEDLQRFSRVFEHRRVAMAHCSRGVR